MIQSMHGTITCASDRQRDRHECGAVGSLELESGEVVAGDGQQTCALPISRGAPL